MNKASLLLVALTLITTAGICQRGEKEMRYFAEPIFTDSSSTIFFPVRYNDELLSDHKMALWGNYYANMVIYDFKADSYRKLFETDVYIEAFGYGSNVRYTTMVDREVKGITAKWVFMKVKTQDYNNSGRVDEHDPFVLFATTRKGENLRQLTDETENVISLDIYEAQGFGLLRIQRDVNKDRSFKNSDKEYYFKKIDLNDLNLGKPIEAK